MATLKLRLAERQSLQLKVLPRYPADIIGGDGIEVTTVGGNKVISIEGGGPVTSFNTRTGAVIPNAGDYAIADIAGLADEFDDVDTALALKAPLASPTFTGDPKAPTATPGDNDTSLATTAFVTAAIAGNVAAKADMEAASSTALAVTPGRQQFHPSAIKAYARLDYSAGVPSVTLGFNVSSVTDVGTGIARPNFTVAFSSASYAIFLSGQPTVEVPISDFYESPAVGSVDLKHYEATTIRDPVHFDFGISGDQ